MVQERLGATTLSAKGVAYQATKKDKDSVAASVGHAPNVTKPTGNKYGAWGPVYKDKQNFINMHYS